MTPVPRSYPMAVATNHIAFRNLGYYLFEAPARHYRADGETLYRSGAMVEIHDDRRISTSTVHARFAFIDRYDLATCEVIGFLDFVVTWAAPVVIFLVFLCRLFSSLFRARRKI